MARDLLSPVAPAPALHPGRPPLRVVPEGGEPAPVGLSTPPPGRWLDLGRRGRTWIREEPGPPGAPALLLLHGLGATGGLNWAGTPAYLGDRYRLVTIDHRGHGRGIRTRHFRLEDCADDAAAVIDALGLHRPVAVGYSMGGPVASLMWRRHPGLLGGLVFCATSRNFGGTPGEKLAFAAMASVRFPPTGWPERGVRRAASSVVSIPARLPLPGPVVVRDALWAASELAGSDPRSVLQAAGAIGRFDCSPWIGRVDIPTSAVITTGDQFVPPLRQFRLARSIPGSTIHCVDVGHLCVAGGTPKVRFLQALRRACADVVG
jgi:3-oxoadipate enol-lactonase